MGVVSPNLQRRNQYCSWRCLAEFLSYCFFNHLHPPLPMFVGGLPILWILERHGVWLPAAGKTAFPSLPCCSGKSVWPRLGHSQASASWFGNSWHKKQGWWRSHPRRRNTVTTSSVLGWLQQGPHRTPSVTQWFWLLWFPLSLLIFQASLLEILWAT